MSVVDDRFKLEYPMLDYIERAMELSSQSGRVWLGTTRKYRSDPRVLSLAHTYTGHGAAAVATAGLLTTGGHSWTLRLVWTRDGHRSRCRRGQHAHAFDHRPADGQTVRVAVAAAMRDVARGRLWTAVEAVLTTHSLGRKHMRVRPQSHASGPEMKP